MVVGWVVGLSVIAAVCLAVQVLTVEAGLARVRGSAAVTAAVVSVVVSTAIFWVLLLGRGVPSGVTPGELVPFVVAGVLNPAVFRVLYFEGIDRVGARIAATIQATYPAVATVVAVATLGETVTVWTAIGIAAIVGGGALLQFTRSTEASVSADLIARELATVDTRDLAYPVVAAVVLGVSYVVVEYGLNGLPAPLVATATAQTTALVVFLGGVVTVPGWRRELSTVSRSAYAFFVVAGVAVAAFWVAQFVALNTGSVVTVVPVVSSAPLFVVGVSYAIAGERPRSAQVVAAVIAIVAGVVLLQLG
ncbi:MAG: EamA family transporter [Halobacteriaceae archaeon]